MTGPSPQVVIKNIPLDEVSNMLTGAIHDEAAKKKKVYIGLPGGSSLLPWYDLVKQEKVFLNLTKSECSQLRFGLVDERVVPLEHEDSNYRSIMDKLGNHCIDSYGFKQQQFIPLNVDSAFPAGEYSSIIPNFDIGLYGIGPDGHIASIFPGDDSLDDFDHLDGFQLIESNPKDKHPRVTVTPEMIKNQEYRFLFIRGKSKQEALEKFSSNDETLHSCPAKILTQGKGHLYVITFD